MTLEKAQVFFLAIIGVMSALALTTGCGGSSSSGIIVVATATPTPTMVATATPTPTPSLGGAMCPAKTHPVTFVNNAQYPVWLAESYNTTTPTIALPPGSNWEIQPKGQTTVCMPNVWQGRFWPRTGCDFSLFGKSAAQCTASSQCDTGNICYGGMCLAQCNPGSGSASKGGGTPFCQSSLALDNTDAFCLNLSGSKNNLGVCTFNPGVVCKTGDCLGLLQCYGTWDGRTATQTGQSPASLFEPSFTSQSGANFDMSLVSGYNVPMAISPSAKSSCTSSSASPACASDLNATCPANLRVTQAPGKGGPIKCGGGTCPSGACVDSTCVLGCNDPCDQCTQRNPSALNAIRT